MNLKCYVRLNRKWRSPLEAYLLAFVPAADTMPFTRTVADNQNLDTISTDCIVRLCTFDKDKLYQVPLDCVEVVDEWKVE